MVAGYGECDVCDCFLGYVSPPLVSALSRLQEKSRRDSQTGNRHDRQELNGKVLMPHSHLPRNGHAHRLRRRNQRLPRRPMPLPPRNLLPRHKQQRQNLHPTSLPLHLRRHPLSLFPTLIAYHWLPMVNPYRCWDVLHGITMLACASGVDV